MKIPHSLRDLQHSLSQKEITIEETLRHYLSVIDEKNPELNVFLEVFDLQALEKAKLLDQEIQQGKFRKLTGLIVGIKDLFCFQGKTMTGGSRILENFESQITATAVSKMEEEGAIIIGRQNCDEFGMGSSNENSAYGPVRNQVDQQYVPGGSSGGSAVAVQSGMCMISLASDTGGSIRQPAAFTGTIGLKPTYGRVSRFGLTAYASSFDCVGLIGNDLETIDQTLEVISGKDEQDHTTVDVSSFREDTIYDQKTTLGTLPEFINQKGIAEDIRNTYHESLHTLRKDFDIHEFEFPFSQYLLPVYYILTSAEASANLSRFDGVRYGHRASEVDSMEQLYKKTRFEAFGKEVIRRIMLGTFVLSANYHDAFYVKADKARSLIKSYLKEMFKSIDILVLPTTPSTAFKLGEKTDDPVEMYLSDIFTTLASIGGFPAISLPAGKNSQGFPIGIQLVCDEFQESRLLNFSKRITLG